MGYVISSVLACYSISYTELMALPVYTLWELEKNTHRIKARDQKTYFVCMVQAIASAFGNDPSKMIKNFESIEGDIVKQEEEAGFDKDKLQTLKKLIHGVK